MKNTLNISKLTSQRLKSLLDAKNSLATQIETIMVTLFESNDITIEPNAKMKINDEITEISLIGN